MTTQHRPNNTTLISYGIQNEKTDWRAHVCVKSGFLYLYPTAAGIEAIEADKYKCVPVKTNGIVTAQGFLVPPDEIRGSIKVPLPYPLLEQLDIKENDSQTVKGAKAQQLVQELFATGRIPLSITAVAVTDTKQQIDGVDLTVQLNMSIQVKCDFNGGDHRWGGSGNLFIQVAECNPYGKH